MAKLAHLYPKAENRVISDQKGYTSDIIAVILAHDRKYFNQCQELAKKLKGRDVEESARNVYNFIRENIRYVLDPDGFQYIESPARTLNKGYGDCKAYSLLASSLLSCMGIKPTFRFVSYSEAPIATHVYIVVEGAKNYIVDACMPNFNSEKQYTHKMDYPTRIMSIAGVGAADSNTTYDFHPALTEGELDVQIQRERAKILADIAHQKGIRGIGATDFQQIYEELDAQLHESSVDGIGKKKAKPKANAKPKSKAAQAAKNFAKNTLKNVAQAVTTPQRLAVKGLLEVTLPQAAPAFLYLFLPANAPVPDNVARKRRKMNGIKNFIVEIIGMKESHFLGIVRNGILKKMGKQPEEVLKDLVKAPAVKGVGFAALIALAVDKLLPFLLSLIGKLSGIFKKKPKEEISKDDLPNEADFAGKDAVKNVAKVLEKLDDAIAEPVSETATGANPNTGSDKPRSGTGTGAGSGSGDGGDDGEEKDNSTIIYMGAAAVAAFFLLKKK